MESFLITATDKALYQKKNLFCCSVYYLLNKGFCILEYVLTILTTVQSLLMMSHNIYSAIPAAIEGMQADWEGDKRESEKMTTLKKKQWNSEHNTKLVTTLRSHHTIVGVLPVGKSICWIPGATTTCTLDGSGELNSQRLHISVILFKHISAGFLKLILVRVIQQPYLELKRQKKYHGAF